MGSRTGEGAEVYVVILICFSAVFGGLVWGLEGGREEG